MRFRECRIDYASSNLVTDFTLSNEERAFLSADYLRRRSVAVSTIERATGAYLVTLGRDEGSIVLDPPNLKAVERNGSKRDKLGKAKVNEANRALHRMIKEWRD